MEKHFTRKDHHQIVGCDSRYDDDTCSYGAHAMQNKSQTVQCVKLVDLWGKCGFQFRKMQSLVPRCSMK